MKFVNIIDMAIKFHQVSKIIAVVGLISGQMLQVAVTYSVLEDHTVQLPRRKLLAVVGINFYLKN